MESKRRRERKRGEMMKKKRKKKMDMIEEREKRPGKKGDKNIYIYDIYTYSYYVLTYIHTHRYICMCVDVMSAFVLIVYQSFNLFNIHSLYILLFHDYQSD